MADKKISALTGATTPLAGTEVLPIVQGGATVKVAVSDLTAGRAVSAASVNKVVITAPATASTLTIADGKTLAVNDNATLGTGGLTLGNSGGFTAAASKVLTASNTLTLAGTDATTQTFPTTSATIARTDAAQTFTGPQTVSGTTSSATVASSNSEQGTNYPTLSVKVANGLGGYFNWYNAAGLPMWGIYSYMGAAGQQGALGVRDLAGGNDRISVATNGVITFGAYGAGAATFSAAGVISSVSDETWKIKDGIPTNPDEMLKNLQPGYWFYNAEKAPQYGYERQLGFYAQNVYSAIGPEAAPEPETYIVKDKDGVETTVTKPWGYYDRSVLAVTVMSLQKALATIESLTARIAALENK
jgi:hypothetical protein